MFSANENLQLRQAKKRVVSWIEELIPEDALDTGINVMVMQVSCKTPGCVPLETAIIIVFPKTDEELLPGLPESQGGSYKTKILKPLSQVTQEDVLEALPPAFPGGKRSMERLCLNARDVMLVQITQLFGDDPDSDVEGRRLMAEYLKQSLQDYIDRGCVPPEWGQPFPELQAKAGDKEPPPTSANTNSSGNIVIRRPVDDDDDEIVAVAPPAAATTTSSSTPSSSSSSSAIVNSVVQRRQQQAVQQRLDSAASPSATSILAQLSQREHAPGVRRPGCPCCDPDNPSNVIDRMMLL